MCVLARLVNCEVTAEVDAAGNRGMVYDRPGTIIGQGNATTFVAVGAWAFDIGP